MSDSVATCNSQFGWMSNELSQSPCEVGSALVTLCHDKELVLTPLSSNSPLYTAPSGGSATVCSCSWAAYNLIEACTLCQGFAAKGWNYWINSGCQTLNLLSTSTYFPANESFSSSTKIPEWAILNPEKWSGQLFNANQAREINSENVSDVTDSDASQPTASFLSSNTNKVPAGAIAGGVIAGVMVLIILGLLIWYFVFLRPRRNRSRDSSKRIDLNADDSTMQLPENPLTSHLHVHGLSIPGMNAAHTDVYGPQMYQTNSPYGFFTGYPTSTNTTTVSPTNNAVPGLVRTKQNSRDSIPTVAEQLDEKRRIRAARQNSGGGGGGAGTSSQSSHAHVITGSSSRLVDGSQEELGTTLNNRISHSHSQSFSPINANMGRTAHGGMLLNKSGKRRQSADGKQKVPWFGRRMVVNVGSVTSGSEAGDSVELNNDDTNNNGNDDNNMPHNTPKLTPDMNVSLPSSGIVATEGQVVSTNDIIARVPGARLPNARERENPPPSYMAPPAS